MVIIFKLEMNIIAENVAANSILEFIEHIIFDIYLEIGIYDIRQERHYNSRNNNKNNNIYYSISIDNKQTYNKNIN